MESESQTPFLKRRALTSLPHCVSFARWSTSFDVSPRKNSVKLKNRLDQAVTFVSSPLKVKPLESEKYHGRIEVREMR